MRLMSLKSAVYAKIDVKKKIIAVAAESENIPRQQTHASCTGRLVKKLQHRICRSA